VPIRTFQVSRCNSCFVRSRRFIHIISSLAVNARISTSYAWIQATTCSLSNYPPVYLCGNEAGGNFVFQQERWRWWYLGAILPGVLYYCIRQASRRWCNDNSGKPQQHLYNAIADVVVMHRTDVTVDDIHGGTP
jgi:hypothetical protein